MLTPQKFVLFFLSALLLSAAPQAEAKGRGRTVHHPHHGRGHGSTKRKKKKGIKKPENMGPADVPPPERTTP